MSNIIVGDVHGEFPSLYNLIRSTSAKIVFQLGDFGWWPRYNGHTTFLSIDRLKQKCPDTNIYWLDGNHENHEDIQLFNTNKQINVFDNIYYQPRGSIMEYNGKTIMFFGGADSVDKHLRTPGLDWFYQETIKENDIYNLPDVNVDIMMTHTAPLFLRNTLIKELSKRTGNIWENSPIDPSMKYLELLFEKYQPKQWFFGHWHLYLKTTLFDCEFTCLESISFNNSWEYF